MKHTIHLKSGNSIECNDYLVEAVGIQYSIEPDAAKGYKAVDNEVKNFPVGFVPIQEVSYISINLV